MPFPSSSIPLPDLDELDDFQLRLDHGRGLTRFECLRLLALARLAGVETDEPSGTDEATHPHAHGRGSAESEANASQPARPPRRPRTRRTP